MWVYTLIATILGAIGTGLSIYNIVYARREPSRKVQAEYRAELKALCDEIAKGLVSGLSELEKGRMPIGFFEGALKGRLIPQLRQLGKELAVPSEAQVQRIVLKLETISDAWALMPDNDESLQNQNSLIWLFNDAVPDVTLVANGLRSIEQGSIRHKALFKGLGK